MAASRSTFAFYFFYVIMNCARFMSRSCTLKIDNTTREIIRKIIRENC